MKKRSLCFALAALLFAGLVPQRARADMGPKPSVTVTFEGFSGESAYATLLSKESAWGPYQVWDGRMDVDRGEDPQVWQAFADYKDPDGFSFVGPYGGCGAHPWLRWGYMPPDVFKVLVYFPETGAFLSSGVLERYAFESFFQCTVAGGEMQVRASYDYVTSIGRAALRAALTILIELVAALLFGYRGRRALGVIALVNLITQALLYGALYLVSYWRGPWAFWFWFFVLELLVLATEAAAYTLLVERASRVRWYALAANALSCGAGLALAVCRALPADCDRIF